MISRLGVPSSISKLPGLLDVAADRDELRAGRVLHADLGVALGAELDDVRQRRQRLDVVDQRRALVEALVGGERRLQARVAAFALERVEQAGLLAADVGAGAAVQDERAVEARAEDVAAEVAGLVGLGDRRVEHVGLLLVLAADVDERLRRVDRVGGDDDALDQLMRVLLHQLAVLERPGLGLVGVDDDVLLHRALRDERGLRAHREAGAAAPAQAGGLERVDQRRARRLERLAQRAVAAAALVDLARREARLVDVLEQQDVGHVRATFGSAHGPAR